MKIMTEQGEAESVWIDVGHLDHVEEGTFARLEVGGCEGLVCTEIRVPRYVDEAAARRIALKAVVAAEGRGCEPSRLLTEGGLEAHVEREGDEDVTSEEIDGRIHNMTSDELHRYGWMSKRVVYSLLAPMIVLPVLAAWLGWDADVAGPWRYVTPAAWALGAFIGAVLLTRFLTEALIGETSLKELANRYAATQRERERRDNPPKVVVIGRED